MFFRAHKNQHPVKHFFVFQQMLDQVQFRPEVGHFKIRLFYQLGRRSRWGHFNSLGESQKLVAHFFYLLVKRSREQQVLPFYRDNFEQLPDLRHKAHIQHAVGFVDHQRFYFLERNSPCLVQIKQPARCCHQNVDARFYQFGVLGPPYAPVNSGVAQVAILSQFFNIFAHLNGQLARWHQDQGAGIFAFCFYQLHKNGQQIGGCFAGSGLCNPQHIGPRTDDRYCLLLNGRRSFEPDFLQGLQDRLIDF